MRESLVSLINNTILFKYHLPNGELSISKSKFSSDDDHCYSVQNNKDLATIIYNSVIEYAFAEFEIQESEFNALHARALKSKLKYNHDATDTQKLKYGFYGEVILYCMLLIHFRSPTAIARGHFYNILENSETKGYDSYHIVQNGDCLELWFGEVKFYQDYKAALTGENGAIKNLKKAVSDKYLNENLVAISEHELYLEQKGKKLRPILDDIKNNPDVKISELSEKYNLKLVYPILIIFDEKKKGYNQAIQEVISHIEDECNNDDFNLSIDRSLFFILIPTNNTSVIKSQVIEWISEKEPLMS